MLVLRFQKCMSSHSRVKMVTHAGDFEDPTMRPQAHVTPDLGSDKVNYTQL